MGAHGTFDEALEGVNAYNAPSSEDEELLDKRREFRTKRSSGVKKHNSKEKSQKSKQKKEKEHKKKEKKSKHKKHKKEKDGRSSSAENSDEGESDEEDMDQQLERGRAAVRITRDILQQQPGLKQELRQLLWRIDQGEAVQIAGIPDPQLRQQVDALFVNINLAKTSNGIYAKRPGSMACLTLLGPVIAEAHLGTSNGTGSEEQTAASQQIAGQSSKGMQAGNGLPEHHSEGEEPSPQQATEQRMPEEQEAGRADQVTADRGAQAGPAEEDLTHAVPDQLMNEIGPAEHRPSVGGDDQEAPGSTAEAQGSRNAASEPAQEAAAEGRRRVAGPAMPTPELLAAAAAAKQAMDAELEEEGDDDLIGPAPPELVMELESARSDDRSKEVTRILRVLDGANAAPDAYAIMGVEPDAKAADVKKRYWRLSLLIHPDKCEHPRANDAFDAVNKAKMDLQDPGKRSAIDADREDARLMRLAEEMAAQQERERQWRVARGTATAEDLRGPIRTGPAERDTWMTELPEFRRPNAQPSQVSVTSFSQRGIQERGDTRGWTETPQQKLLRLSAGEAASTRALESAPAPSVAAGAVDAYNQAHRAKTLVEQHKERLKDQKRKKKKQKLEEKSKGKAEADADDWDPKAHPWRPFDREKDLNIGPKAVTKEELLKKAGNLDTRFAGTATGQRSFL